MAVHCINFGRTHLGAPAPLSAPAISFARDFAALHFGLSDFQTPITRSILDGFP